MKRIITAIILGVSTYFANKKYHLVARAVLLTTRKSKWQDAKGNVEVVNEKLSTAWTLAGPHPWMWWWVIKWGKNECGCTYNPLTKKRYLVCLPHSGDLGRRIN